MEGVVFQSVSLRETQHGREPNRAEVSEVGR